MRDSLIGNPETTVNLLGAAMEAFTPTKKVEEVKKAEVLTPKQQRRADRKAVRLRKKG